MPRTFVLSFLLSGLLWLVCVRLVDGFAEQKEPEKHPQPATRSQNEKSASIPLKKAVVDSSVREAPEVLSYFKERGWLLYRKDGKPGKQRSVVLNVRDPKNPFGTFRISIDDYKMLAKSQSAEILEFSSVEATDEGLAILAKMPRLKGINIMSTDVTDAGLKALAECQTLQRIDLATAREVTDAGLRELARLPKLEILRLSHMNLTGEGFGAFAGKASLRRLALRNIKGLSDKAALHIAKLPNLDKLVITKPDETLTTAGIKSIAVVRVPAEFRFDNELLDDELFITLVKNGWLYGPVTPGIDVDKPATPAGLKYLDLGGATKLTDTGLAAIFDCTNLEGLNLEDTGVTDVSFQHFAKFQQLSLVHLGNTQVTGAGLSAISHLPIGFLIIRESELSEAHFKAIGKMSKLKELWLPESEFDPRSLKHLKNLNQVWSMNFYKTPFNDTAANCLPSLPNLSHLYLDQSQIGDAGLRELLERPHIVKLSLEGTNVTKEAYQKTKMQYPKKFLRHDRYEEE